MVVNLIVDDYKCVSNITCQDNMNLAAEYLSEDRRTTTVTFYKCFALPIRPLLVVTSNRKATESLIVIGFMEIKKLFLLRHQLLQQIIAIHVQIRSSLYVLQEDQDSLLHLQQNRWFLVLQINIHKIKSGQ